MRSPPFAPSCEVSRTQGVNVMSPGSCRSTASPRGVSRKSCACAPAAHSKAHTSGTQRLRLFMCVLRLARAALGRVGRFPPPPEPFGLDVELVALVAARGAPRIHDFFAHRVEALLDEPRLLEVGHVRDAQYRGRLAQLGEQQLEPRPP